MWNQIGGLVILALVLVAGGVLIYGSIKLDDESMKAKGPLYDENGARIPSQWPTAPF